jgi:hypothetical protein
MMLSRLRVAQYQPSSKTIADQLFSCFAEVRKTNEQLIR